MGGLSREREISFRSGRAVAQALRTRGYSVAEIDGRRDVALRLREEKIEVAVVMLHGRWGEDGTIQGLLEIQGIPYTGSGVLGSAIAMDKDLTKRLVRDAGGVTPPWICIPASERGRLSTPPFSLPLMVKPNREGSTLGATIVKNLAAFRPALELAASFDSQVLVEQFLTGTELTVGLLNGQPLPVLEIVPKSGFYDYQSKYTKGATEYIVPARISERVAHQAQEISSKIYQWLGLDGVARADFILTDQPSFLEINTVPGMTETSLVPKAAQAAGISFEELCERILQGASLKV